MTYPTLDIRILTLNQAKDIYKRDWWDKLGMDKYPPALSYQIVVQNLRYAAEGN